MNRKLHEFSPSLKELGWNNSLEKWASKFPGTTPGRIARTNRGYCLVFAGDSAAITAASGSVRTKTGVAPSTGDYVMIDEEDGQHLVTEIAKRRTALTRRLPGKYPEPQVLAANVDDVFVMHGLDRPVNIRRLERQLVIAWESGAKPFVLLTKADKVKHHEEAVEHIQRVAPGVDCLAISTHSGQNIDKVRKRFTGTRTVALMGLSGIGKSTLVNELSGGEVQRTAQVRAVDRRGRHTTVTRDLIPLPGGGIVVDTPGIREIGLWQAWDGLKLTFPDLAEAAEQCKFSDCTHKREPDCGVRNAKGAGLVTQARIDHYRELEAELLAQRDELEEFSRRAESRNRAGAEERQDQKQQRSRKANRSGGGRGRTGR